MNKKHLRVIKEIQSRIDPELLKKLTKMEKVSPAVKEVFEKALLKPDSEVSPRKKRAIRAVLDSGKLDREIEVLDRVVEQEIDAFFTAEIDKAVKLGRLPKEAPKLEALTKKGTQYARRQEKRLRAEFGAEDRDVADTAEDDQDHKAQHQPRSSDNPFVPVPSAARR